MLNAVTKPEVCVNPATKKKYLPPTARIAALVAHRFGMTFAEIIGDSRLDAHVEARQLVMWLAIKRGLSRSHTARALKRDPSTITYGLHAFQDKIARMPRLERLAASLLVELEGQP